MELSPLAKQMVVIADEVAVALAAHRAVVRVADHTGEVALFKRPFRERADDAIDRVTKAIATIDYQRADAAGGEGDLRRHLAAIYEYLEQPASAIEQLDLAAHRYRRLVDQGSGDGPPHSGLIDKFGVAVASFTQATVLRRMGRLSDASEALNNAREQVPGSGFDYATGIICAEAELVNHLSGKGDPISSLRQELGSLRTRGLFREAGYVLGMMACLEASSERAADLDSSQQHLREAAVRFGRRDDATGADDDSAFYPPGSEVERVLDIAVANYRRGLVLEAMDRREDALAEFSRALQMLNRVPAGWYRADYQGDPLGLPFNTIHEAAQRLCYGLAGVPAARLVLRVAENLRRSSLAGFLRGEVRKMYRADLDQEIDHKRDFRPEIAADRMLDEQRLQEERTTQSQGYLSESFVDAFYPRPVDYEAIDQAICFGGDRHVLVTLITKEDEGETRGVTVWVPAGGRDPVLQSFSLTPALIRFIHGLRSRAQTRGTSLGLAGSDPAVWQRLAESLLPKTLRIELLNARAPGEMVVVPDGILGYLPWPALMIDESHRLVQFADLAVVPSISLLRRSRFGLRHGARKALVGLDSQFQEDEAFVTSWQEAWCEAVEAGRADVATLGPTLEAVKVALARSAAGGKAAEPTLLYLVTHGEGDDHDQHIQFTTSMDRPDGDAIWVNDALFIEWPNIVVLASCHVSRIHPTLGTEPLALPIACLCGGASVFIAGVHEAAVGHAPEFHRHLIGELTRCDPVHALGEAQRAWLANVDPSEPDELANWAALRAYVLG